MQLSPEANDDGHAARPSRAAIARFFTKVFVSIVLASLSKAGYVFGLSIWLTLHAVITALLALLSRESFEPKSFNHWDEALWLTAGSTGVLLVQKGLAT